MSTTSSPHVRHNRKLFSSNGVLLFQIWVWSIYYRNIPFFLTLQFRAKQPSPQIYSLSLFRALALCESLLVSFQVKFQKEKGGKGGGGLFQITNLEKSGNPLTWEWEVPRRGGGGAVPAELQGKKKRSSTPGPLGGFCFFVSFFAILSLLFSVSWFFLSIFLSVFLSKNPTKMVFFFIRSLNLSNL